MTFKEDLNKMMQRFPEGNFRIFKVRHYNEKGHRQTIVELGGYFVVNKNTNINQREGNKIFSAIKKLLKNYKVLQ